MKSESAQKPLVRWAGSKRKLLPRLSQYWKSSYLRYVEPFAGSAALFYSLRPEKALLSDINRDLISTLITTRRFPDKVYDVLARYPVNEKVYYRLRAADSSTLDSIRAAARFLYLNRNCFNGIYRTNRAGKFNVPFSGNGQGGLMPRDMFVASAHLLRNAELDRCDFETVLLERVAAGDFVYLDPPYAVASRRVFREYGLNSFQIGDLERLNSALEIITKRGAHFVLSYAYCSEAIKVFQQWHKKKVMIQRHISGFAHHRRRAAEVLITNIPGYAAKEY
jgi:DNA adenine methylase